MIIVSSSSGGGGGGIQQATQRGVSCDHHSRLQGTTVRQVKDNGNLKIKTNFRFICWRVGLLILQAKLFTVTCYWLD